MITSIASLRVEAARNTGVTVSFFQRFGRDFNGSVADYSELTVAQQAALTDEMEAIIRANPDRFTPQQVAVANSHGGKKFTDIVKGVEDKTVIQAALEGAGEGLSNVGKNLNVVASTTNSLLTKTLWIAGIGAALYLIVTYAPKPSVQRNPARRRRRSRQ